MPEVPNSLDTVYRMYLITMAAQVGSDISVARSILRELEYHRQQGVLTQDLMGLVPGNLPCGSSRVLRRVAEGRPYRPLTVHRYRPHKAFGGVAGLLDFSASFIDELIAQGYHDAVHHNCAEENCILPLET